MYVVPKAMYALMLTGLQLFIAWVVVSLIWLWITLFIANFYPLVDGGAKKIWLVLRGKKQIESGQVTGTSTPLADKPADSKGLEQVFASEKDVHA